MGARVSLVGALLAAGMAVSAQAAPAADTKSFGAPLIEKSAKLDEPDPKGARFLVPRNFNETVKFYKKLWRGNENIEFRKIVNLPSIRAVHVMNRSPKSEWEGMNIYEHKGETRIFILPRTKPQEAPPAAK
ncbi:MAG: hypothetical protein HY897_15250 [Deltaproteobacteria bacterium]|nr:hypothetical protein [Deltaproteobacteria bacterium]